MTKKMTVIVPSRGRPKKVRELMQSFAETRSRGSTVLVIGVDEDDPDLNEYEALENLKLDFVKFEYGPRLRLGGTLNKLAVKYAKTYDVIGFMGDDHRPRTVGWDTQFVERANTTRIMYGNDLIQGPNLPTAVFMTSDIINILEYMVPPTMVHLFLDNFWKELGLRLGRLDYLGNVIIEHMHPVAQKSEWDERYVEVNSADQWNADEAAWKEYVEGGLFDRDIHAIKLTW